MCCCRHVVSGQRALPSNRVRDGSDGCLADKRQLTKLTLPAQTVRDCQRGLVWLVHASWSLCLCAFVVALCRARVRLGLVIKGGLGTTLVEASVSLSHFFELNRCAQQRGSCLASCSCCSGSLGGLGCAMWVVSRAICWSGPYYLAWFPWWV
jgi:hypothetical protein